MLEVVTTNLKYTIRPILAYERHPCGFEPCSTYTRVFSLFPFMSQLSQRGENPFCHSPHPAFFSRMNNDGQIHLHLPMGSIICPMSKQASETMNFLSWLMRPLAFMENIFGSVQTEFERTPRTLPQSFLQWKQSHDNSSSS